MSIFSKYVLNPKFKRSFITNSTSFGNRFHDGVKQLDVTSETVGQTVPSGTVWFERISDATGLDRAYRSGGTHLNNKTLYIVGTHTLTDVVDDSPKTPVWGYLTDSTRYKAADNVLKHIPQIETLVGHSLAGSVALEVQKQYPDRKLKVRT